MERAEPYYYRPLLSILAQNTDDNILLFFMNKAAAAKTKLRIFCKFLHQFFPRKGK